MVLRKPLSIVLSLIMAVLLTAMIVEVAGADSCGDPDCTVVGIVDIDIKPGSDPNSINSKSNGLVPVAILGSTGFDITNIDVNNPPTFGPTGATPKHDLTDAAVLAEHQQIASGGFYTDLVLHYAQKETGLTSSNTEACLTGQLMNGTSIEGCDAVRVK